MLIIEVIHKLEAFVLLKFIKYAYLVGLIWWVFIYRKQVTTYEIKHFYFYHDMDLINDIFALTCV